MGIDCLAEERRHQSSLSALLLLPEGEATVSASNNKHPASGGAASERTDLSHTADE